MYNNLISRGTCPAYNPEPAPSPECRLSERCLGCPYPAHGFVCWHDEEHCVRTEMKKIYERSKTT